MKLFMNTDKGKKGLAVRLICLILAVVMLLAACGEDTATTTKKKKKKVVVIQQPETSDVDNTSSDEEPYDEEPTDEEPSDEEPYDEEPSDEEPYDEEPADEEPADEEPYDEEPADEEPADEEPADEEPADEEPADDTSSDTTSDEEDEGEDLKAEPIIDRSFKKSTVPSQYSKLVWSDEFNGTELDKTKWSYPPNYYLTGKEDYVYTTEKTHAYMKDGCYNTLGTRYFDPYNPQYTYATVPTITTEYDMRFRYGYVEYCVKMPFNTAIWPSFWTQSEVNDTECLGEVDIYEVFGSKDTVVPSLHKWYMQEAIDKGAPKHTQIGSNAKSTYVFENSENLANEFHVYGFEWTDTYMAMSVDGVEYNRFNITDDANYDGYGDMRSFRQPMWILLGSGVISPYVLEKNAFLTMGGISASAVDNDLPFIHSADWIRIYQNPNQEGNVINTDTETFVYRH